MNRVLLGISLLAAAIVLNSCITYAVSQEKIEGFPYQEFREVRNSDEIQKMQLARELKVYPANGLSFQASQDLGFPDTYLFAQRNQGEIFFDAFVADLIARFKVPVDQRLISKLEQVLVYMPQGSTTIQILLLGDISKDYTRVAFMGAGYNQRLVFNKDNDYSYVYERDDGNIHAAVIKTGLLAVQIDAFGRMSDNDKNLFSLLVQRTYALTNGLYDPVLKLQATRLRETKKTNSAANQSLDDIDRGTTVVRKSAAIEEAELPSFSEALIWEVDEPAVASYISIGNVPAGLPVAAIRARLAPIKDSKNVALALTLKASPDGMPALRSAARLVLLDLAKNFNIPQDLIEAAVFTEVNDRLVIEFNSLLQTEASNILLALSHPEKLFADSKK